MTILGSWSPSTGVPWNGSVVGSRAGWDTGGTSWSIASARTRPSAKRTRCPERPSSDSTPSPTDTVDVDEPLHWHEFDSVSWVIEGTGAFADEHGNVTHVSPGCRLDAPAGWLHRNLAGGPFRIVLGTNLPGSSWTMPIDKDPADRPAHLAV